MIKAGILDDGSVKIYGGTVSDSVKFEKIKFYFPGSWNGFSKTAVFKSGSTTVNIVLDSENLYCTGADECYIPHEVIKSPGFYVSVFGVIGEKLATAAEGFVSVIESGYAVGGAPQPATQSEYSQIIGIVNEAKAVAQSVRNDADNGLFNGEKGDKGDRGDGAEITVDQTYNPISDNPQSGRAVAEAVTSENLKITQNNSANKYGIKWSITDNTDLGTRCFAATGLTATIGIGNTDGFSDFDSIYPWSEMKRCNIKKNSNGSNIVTFEGEVGFSLDGTNGDVFVRIPKFCVEKYIKDGYEYRVISANGGAVHPAFIENGVVLNEIFVGAFEGKIDTDNKLRSVSGVIPTNNKISADFLASAKENGTNYTLYDMRSVDAIWTLMAVEYGCRNTNHILGYGFSEFMQPIPGGYLTSVVTETNVNRFVLNKLPYTVPPYMPVGSNITVCKGDQRTILTQAKLLSLTTSVDGTKTVITFDGAPINTDTTCFIGSAPCTTNFCESCSEPISWHTGRANFVNNSKTRNPIRYRMIENIFGSVWHFLPDVTFHGRQMYVCDNMRDYEMGKHEDTYRPVGGILPGNADNGNSQDLQNANYWITSLVNDTFAKGISFGKSFDKSLTSKDGFGAYYYLDDGTKTVANGGGFDHLYRCNMLTNRAWITASDRWHLYGGRLLYKNIEGIKSNPGSNKFGKITVPYSALVDVTPNIMTEIETLDGDIEITLRSGENNYDNEWDFSVTNGNTANIVTLPNVQWTLGFAPAFSANTVTVCRLYFIGNTLFGEWVST